MRILIAVLATIFIFQLGFASETVKGAKADIAKVKSDLNQKLKEVDKEIDELSLKAKEKGQAVKQETVEELKATRKKIADEIEQVKDDGKDTWKQWKAKLADSIDSLSKKAQKALKE